MGQPSDCVLCGRDVWDDAPIPLCRGHMIHAAGFVEVQKQRALSELGQSSTAAVAEAERQAGFQSQVYYLRFGDRIKIGCAISPAKRAMALSIDPSNIAATEHGGYAREAERHRQFAHLRIEGEWFTAAGDLLAHVASLAVA